MNPIPLQRRQHPIFSPIALLSSLLLIGGLSVAVWLTGGRAFSPGDLSALNHGGAPVGDVMAHADLEDSCARCHAPFAGVDAARCEACHTAVATERTNDGLHGRFPQPARCADCHSEHQGASYDLILAAVDGFDHAFTSFSLAQHERGYDGAPLACEACHAAARSFTMETDACVACHADADPPFMATHLQAYGAACLACHDGTNGLSGMTAADHAAFFPLIGRHAAAGCAACHAGRALPETPKECVNCHAEPDVHRDFFSVDCAACHTPEGWRPALLDDAPFDHAQSTRFSLEQHLVNVDERPFRCASCHESGAGAAADLAFAESQCTECHALFQPDFVVPHAEAVGAACLACHDGTGRMASFDHAAIWPLEGRHAEIVCADCHNDQVYAGTPRECAACHAEPEVHRGVFGTDCAACHNPSGWTPARLTRHSFPLAHGGEGEIACTTCHTQTFVAYTCTNCHAHDAVEMADEHAKEGIGAGLLAGCADCHPTGNKEEAEQFWDGN